MSLGIAPLLVAAGMASIAGAISGAWLGWKEKDYDGWKASVPRPKAPPAPAAPQTGQDLISWTPEKLDAADIRNWDEWKRTALPDPPTPPEDENLLFAALAVAAVSLLVVMRK